MLRLPLGNMIINKVKVNNNVFHFLVEDGLTKGYEHQHCYNV